MDQCCMAINGSGNDAAGPPPRAEATGQVLLQSLTVVVALCGLLGNGAVAWLICAAPKKHPFSVYTLSLAAADLAHLCSQLVFCARQLLRPVLGGCFPLPSILVVLRFCSYFTGLGVMTAISCQRCLSVLFPIWYRCHCPQHLPVGVSVLLWLLTFLVNVLRGHACGQLLRPSPFCLGLVIVVHAWVLLLLVTMGTSSLLLLRRVRAGAHHHLPRKVYRVTLLTALVFFLCGMPLSVTQLLALRDGCRALQDTSVLLSCVNSTVNPAIYFFIAGPQEQLPRAPPTGVSGKPQGRGQSPGEASAQPSTEGGP